MWRRVRSLSSFLTSPSRSFLLNPNQEAYGHRICKSLCTDAGKSGSSGFFSRDHCPYIAFVLGGPGSGKGTQCTKIVENFGFTHLSAGDLLRKEITSDSKDGSMIFQMIKEGNIVPSEVTVKLLQKAISLSENNKFLIDGFPRTEENRISYERIIGTEPNMVLFFHCPEEEMIKRVLNRNEGRIDDNEETVKARLNVFRGLSLPVVNYYAAKGKLHKINGTGSEEEIFERVKPIFAALRAFKDRGVIQ